MLLFFFFTRPDCCYKYFFPAATTLARKTGLPKGVSTRQKGFMIAFNQTSKTSAKNCRIASSVCGLVGLLAMLVLPVVVLPAEREEEEPPVALRERVEGGREVYGPKGEKEVGVWREVGGVFGGWGRCRRRNLLEVGVRKAEMWDEAKWSIRLRYLQPQVNVPHSFLKFFF